MWFWHNKKQVQQQSLPPIPPRRPAPVRYKLPRGMKRTVRTPAGDVELRTGEGYYQGTGIFVTFPEGFEYSEELAVAFYTATDGQFHMDVAPPSSSGGEGGDAIITAGRGPYGYEDYEAGRQKGYFKCTDAPKLEMVELVLPGVMFYTMSTV